MKLVQSLCVAVFALALSACGGGGGSGGASLSGTSGTSNLGTSTNGNTQTTAVGSISIDVLGGAGATSSSISALEIAQAKVTLKDASGVAIPGIVVTFAEVGTGLLSIAPASKTALTDDAGQASVEIRALTSTSIGATQIGASATIFNQAVKAQKALAISSAPITNIVSPQDLANAINFLDVNPADKSIVLAGSGGNGRSESATLRFRVVDKNNTPVKNTKVTFSVIPAADATLNVTNATSDADGVVVTTVSSKTVATAVVVKALVDTRTISTQSDQLLITTGLVTQAGFDLSASKFNLNDGITGDSSDITVSIVDANGNRVADGVPVVFTTNYGAVGTSSRGGCSTLNGSCVVTYSVQNPRPVDGTRARVIASTQVGTGTKVSGSLDLTVSNIGLVNLYDAASGGAMVSAATGNACKFTFSAFLGTPAGFPAPAGSTVSVKSLTSNTFASVIAGTPVLDRALTRTPVTIEFDASQLFASACTTQSARVEVMLTAGTQVSTLFVDVSFP